MTTKGLPVALATGILWTLCGRPAVAAGDPLLDVARKISTEAATKGQAHANLRELTMIGPRLSGSAGAAKAIEWAKAKMAAYGFDRVVLMPTMVPHWTRGPIEQATAILTTRSPLALKVAALGPSVGTPKDGVTAGAVEVHSFDEVETLGPAVRGKIVFYKPSMGSGGKNAFRAYGRSVDQRYRGASVAAGQGAVAVLVRSITNLPDDDSPHTGMLRCETGLPQIPAAALSTHSANELSAALKSDPKLTVNLKLSAAPHPDVPSFNVVDEWTGRDLPQEYVVVGGHLDSWDLGPGAHDDGAGVVQSIEVIRILKALGLRPRRTVRVVLFMAEEFGGIGAKDYAAQVKAKGEKHVAAIESDSGGFAPVGFDVAGTNAQVAGVKRFAPYLGLFHADAIEKGGSGTDVAPLGPLGAVTIGYRPVSTHYFDFHHSARDRLEAVNAEDLEDGAAAMATLTDLLAEKGM